MDNDTMALSNKKCVLCNGLRPVMSEDKTFWK